MNKRTFVFCLVFLASCSSPQSETGKRAKYKDPDYIRYDIDTGSYVREFHLEDGTRCVAMIDTGIICQWKVEAMKVE